MTVSSTPRKAGPFSGNGVTTSFPFTFKVFAATDIEVTKTITATGAQSVLVLDSDYSVTLNVDQDANPGGTVGYPLLGSPLPAGQTLAMVDVAPLTQEADIGNAGSFLPKVIEDALDRITIFTQRLLELAGRALTFPVGETTTTLPPVAQRAGRVFVWDVDGNPSVGVEADTTSASIQAAAAAGSATAAAGSATAAAGSATAAAGSATAAAGSATAAASSASTAETYASTAASGAKYYDTIALGAAGVAVGSTFGVKAGGPDNLPYPTLYKNVDGTAGNALKLYQPATFAELGNPGAWAKVLRDVLATFKTTETLGATTGATGVGAGVYAGDETTTSTSGVLKSFSVLTSGAGSAQMFVCQPQDATHWTVSHVLPVTFAGAGVKTFTAGADFADNIVIAQGGFLALKTTGALLLVSSTSTDAVGERPAKYYDVSGATGVGATVTVGGGGPYDPGFSYTLETVDISSVLQSKVNAALTYAGQNYSLSPLLAASKAYFIGDSTVAFFNTRASLSSRIGSVRTLIDVATPGDTIAQQKTRWQALTITPSQVGYVYIQIGLNNIDGNAANTATIIAALQDLVNTVRTSIGADKKIVIGTMTPAKQRWIDVFGAGVGATAQTQWSDINTAIAGGGGSPITGVDARVTSHSTSMADASGNLASYYDTGDHIHPLNGGRNVNAAAIKAGLNTLGMVP